MINADVTHRLFDLVTGNTLADVPLAADDELHNKVGREDTTTFALDTYDRAVYDPVRAPDKPVTWHQSLQPRKTMIAQLIDKKPAQVWVVTDTDTGAASVPIASSTLEHCLSKCYLDDDVSGTFDESEAIAQVLAKANVEDKFGFIVRSWPCGRTADVDYRAADRNTVLDIITDRMTKIPGAAEWRIVADWHDDTQLRLDKIIEIAPQIGIDRPNAIFDLYVGRDGKPSGTIETYSRKTTGGPTRIVGATEGSAAITTDPQTDDDLVAAGWAVWEEQLVFTDISDDDPDPDSTLLKRARARLKGTSTGIVTWTIVGNDNAPQPGVDFNPGDTVHVDVAPRIPEDPTGGTAAVRVLGYAATLRNGQLVRVSIDVWEDPDG